MYLLLYWLFLNLSLTPDFFNERGLQFTDKLIYSIYLYKARNGHSLTH